MSRVQQLAGHSQGARSASSAQCAISSPTTNRRVVAVGPPSSFSQAKKKNELLEESGQVLVGSSAPYRPTTRTCSGTHIEYKEVCHNIRKRRCGVIFRFLPMVRFYTSRSPVNTTRSNAIPKEGTQNVHTRGVFRGGHQYPAPPPAQ